MPIIFVHWEYLDKSAKFRMKCLTQYVGFGPIKIN